MDESDLLVEHFECYFKHPDPFHNVLTIGDQGFACANVRQALRYLGHAGHDLDDSVDQKSFDLGVAKAVRRFQEEAGNPIVDGKVGPNTRRRLIKALVAKYGPQIFQRLDSPRPTTPNVFISYAWEDGARVDKIDQWLRNNGVNVIRDVDFFIPGLTLEENIRSAVAHADHVIVVYSAQSKGREWPRLEQAVGEELEKQLQTRLLLYVRLDDTPLPVHDQTRVAINAAGRILRDVGNDILRALYRKGRPPRHIDINEDEPL